MHKETIYMSFNNEAKIAARATLRPGQANGARLGQARFYSIPKFLLILSSIGGNIFEINNSI